MKTRAILRSLEQVMKNEFEKVITLTDPNRINEILRNNDVDIVMLDMNFKSGIHNGNEGLFWMREIFRYRQQYQCNYCYSIRRY